MGNRKSFIVVEDEKYICDEYRQCVGNHEGLYLIDTTDNTPDAVRLVQEYTPDAVVLDIELNSGSGSGITFLDAIKDTCPDKKPFILTVTNLPSAYMHEQIHKRGGDFIITKDKPDYSVDYVLDMIDTLVSESSLSKSRESELAKITMKQEYSKRLKDKIATEMNLICLKPSHKGTIYLKEAIEMNIKERPRNIAKAIADNHGTTADSVEKAMRHAINFAWRNDDIDVLLTHYTAVIDSERGAPSPTEFIYYYVEKIKREL